MKIRSEHARLLPAEPEELGRLVASIGTDHDQLWPTETWPTNALHLDKPVTTVGARGGHSSLYYSVETYEPGRRLTFRFERRSGLTGTHGLEIDPAGGGKSTLRHVLDVQLRPRLVPVAWLLRAAHDAMVEDLLDNAERAVTGRAAGPPQGKRWVRRVNEIEARRHRRAGAAKAA